MIIALRHFLVWTLVWLATAWLLVTAIQPRSPNARPSISGRDALYRGVLAGQDTITHDYPATWWGWGQVRSTGKLPLWNPSWFGGMPFVASQTFMPFYPPNWLGAVLPFPLAFNIQYPLHLVLAAMVMAAVLRRRGLGWWAAGLGGLAWGFGGHLATLVGPGHIQKLQALVWLPLVAHGGWCLGRGRRREGAATLAGGMALQVCAGHLQIVYLSLAVAVIEALTGWLPVVFKRRVGDAPRTARRRTVQLIGFGTLGVGTALALSAVFWIPTVEFALRSNRQGKLDWEDATRGSLPPEEAAEFILPRLRGDSMPHGRGLYRGRYGESITSSPERTVSDYVGAGVLVFALIALVSGGARRRAAWGYTLLATAALALSLGKYTPIVYKTALVIIPGLSHFRSPSTMMALLAYGLTIAAALGVETIFAEPVNGPGKAKRFHRRLSVAMLVLAVVLCAVNLKGRLWLRAQSAEARSAPPIVQRGPAAVRTHLFVTSLTHTVQSGALILLVAGALGLVRTRGAGGGSRSATRLLGAALVAIWAGDLVANAGPFWNVEAAEPYHEFLTHHWARPYWDGQREPVRYLHVDNELQNWALTLSDFEKGLSIGSFHGYHPVANRRYFQILDRLGFLHPNIARMFGMRYLIWPAQRPRLKGWVELTRHGDLTLLYNPAIQYIHPVLHARLVETLDELLDRVEDPDFDPYTSTTCLADAPLAKDQRRRIDRKPPGLEASVETRGPGEVHIELASRRDALAVVREPFDPGWRLWFGGGRKRTEAKLLEADGYFLLFNVPAGRSHAALVYDPASQRLGLHITLFTLALMAAWVGARLGRRRENAR